MKIDAHHHLWDLQAVSYPWLMDKGTKRFFGDPAPIRRDYLLAEFSWDASSTGVGASVHIQVGAADSWAEAQWVQAVADKNQEWPLVQVAFCDLAKPDFAEQLERYKALSTVRGVRQIVGRAPGEDAHTGTNALLDDPAFRAGLRRLPEFGLSYDLQLLPELMKKTARVLEKCPETKVALCHAGSPHDRSPAGIAAWKNELRHLSALSNVTCKLSGLGMFDHHWTAQSIKPIVEICLEQFGPDRCMFGSNFPVDSLYSDYAKLMTAYETLIPEQDKPAVFFATARQFYVMDVAA
ncbi:MAG: amidohydrolase family protein [Pseudomonadota bacterium]